MSLNKRSILAMLAFAAALAIGCSGEDRPNRPNVEVIGGEGSVSVSDAGPETGTGNATPRPTSTAFGPPNTPTPGPAAAPGKYAPSSNVDSYFAMPTDLKEMRTALNASKPDFAKAEELYSKGKNQQVNGAARSLASIPNDTVHAVFPNGPAVYGRPNFIDGLVKDGLAGTGRAAGLPDEARREIVDKGVLMLFYGKALQEFAAAKTRLDNSATNPGVPVDETWAIVAGVAQGGSYPDSLLAIAATRERDFKLEGKLAGPLEASLAVSLAAAQKNDKAAFEKAYNDARGFINAIFYLSALRDAKLLEADATQAARQTHLAEGWGYWQTIRALAASGSSSAAQTIETALSANGSSPWTTADTTKVYGALNDAAVLQALGIPSALQVKTPPTQ